MVALLYAVVSRLAVFLLSMAFMVLYSLFAIYHSLWPTHKKSELLNMHEVRSGSSQHKTSHFVLYIIYKNMRI